MAGRCGNALVFTLCLLPLVHNDDQCRNSFLLSVTNKTEGMEIALIPDNNYLDALTQEKTYKVLLLPQSFVSPECGEHGLRCSRITTFQTEVSHRHIALIPLLNGLLIVDINVRNMSFQYKVIFTETCSPTAVLPILQSFYTVCANSSTGHLYLHEIRVNRVEVTESYLTAPLAVVTLEEPPALSNFVFVELGRRTDDQQIYFTTGSSLYALMPLSSDASYVGNIDSCKSVHTLVYLGDWVILAYCSGGSLVYFDLQDEDVQVENPMDYGRPIICPNTSVNLRVYRDSDGSSYIKYSLKEDGKRTEYDLPGADYHSGVCFAAESPHVFLAFTDSQEGVFVLDLPSLEQLQVSSGPCQEGICKPLLVINSTYIVSQGVSGVRVIYREGDNLSREIIIATHLQPHLLMVIESQYRCSPTTDGPPPTNEKQNTLPKAVIIAPTVLAAVILVIVAVIAITVTMYLCNKRQNNHYPMQESAPGGSPPPPPLVIANVNQSPLLMATKTFNGSGRSDFDKVSSTVTSSATSSPKSTTKGEENDPLAVELVDQELTFRTEPSSASMSTMSGRAEIEPGMNAIKTTCV